MKKILCLLLLAAPAFAHMDSTAVTYLGTFGIAVAESDLSGGASLSSIVYLDDCGLETDPTPSDGYPGCLLVTARQETVDVAMIDIVAPEVVAEGNQNNTYYTNTLPKASRVSDYFRPDERADTSKIFDELDAEANWDNRHLGCLAEDPTSGIGIVCCGYDWYNVSDVDYKSHCWFDIDDTGANAKGSYGFNAYSMQRARYGGTVNQAWANSHLGASGTSYCFAGQQRPGGGDTNSSPGPTLHAFPCAKPADAEGTFLTSDTAILEWPAISPIDTTQEGLAPGFSPASETTGIAWFEDTVIAVVNNADGPYWWYGQADPYTDPSAHRSGCLFNQGSPDACFNDRGIALPAGTEDLCDTSKGYHAVTNATGGVQNEVIMYFLDGSDLATNSQLQEYESLTASEFWVDNCSESLGVTHDGDILYVVEALPGSGFFNKRLIHMYDLPADNPGTPPEPSPRCCN